MGEFRSGWYERKEVQKVTIDWVKTNCRLTERESELLKIVYDRKLVRRDHLEIISESYRNSGNSRTFLVNRAIRKLFRQMLFDKIHTQQEIGRGNTPCIVSIDKGGSILLGVPHKKRILQKKTIHKGEDYITRSLPINYRHINGVNQTEVDTILFCDSTHHQLLEWKHEVAIKMIYKGEDMSFIPDVFMELRFRDKQFLGFLEYDTGSENHRNKAEFPIIYNKLINYKRYKSSSLWTNDYKYFPVILLVTEDDKRIPYFNKKCKELGLQGIGIYYENYTKVLNHLSNM